MKPETISDNEFDFVEKALPDEDDAEPQKVPAATPAPQTAKTGAAKAKPQKSLTQTIKETAGEDDDESSSPLSGTWVEKLATTSFSSDDTTADRKETGSINLEKMVSSSKNGNRRSNASVFDISGLMLRMNLPQAEATMAKRGFKRISQKFEIPNFIKWRYEEQ